MARGDRNGLVFTNSILKFIETNDQITNGDLIANIKLRKGLLTNTQSYCIGEKVGFLLSKNKNGK